MSEAVSTLTVHGLVCHNHVNMAITCFGSLLKFSTEPLHLVIHDDGSLTPEDTQKLLSSLEGSTIVSRAEADELMNQQLKNYPNSYKYRDENIYGLKLLDISLLSQTDFAFCDSDILFLRPFSGMFRWPNAETSALFMQDYLNSYSILPWHLLGADKPKMPSKVNSGLIFFRKSAYDLDFIEWVLGRDEFRHKVGWLEQTCWAALGYRAGCRLWNPQQIALMRPKTRLTDPLVAGHFVKEARYRMGEFLAATEDLPQTSTPVVVETITSQDCNLLELAQVHGMRQLKRARNYHKIPSMLRQKFSGSYQEIT